jgi:uncharacterized membrane protein YidH (DUF202 family)
MRTYLAWVRTSVALLAAAAALVQLVPSFAAEIIAITNGLQLEVVPPAVEVRRRSG